MTYFLLIEGTQIQWSQNNIDDIDIPMVSYQKK